MAFRLVRAENVWKSPGDSLRRSKIEAKVVPTEKKRRWNCCVGWGEMVEARPGGSWYSIMELQGFVISV